MIQQKKSFFLKIRDWHAEYWSRNVVLKWKILQRMYGSLMFLPPSCFVFCRIDFFFETDMDKYIKNNLYQPKLNNSNVCKKREIRTCIHSYILITECEISPGKYLPEVFHCSEPASVAWSARKTEGKYFPEQTKETRLLRYLFHGFSFTSVK